MTLLDFHPTDDFAEIEALYSEPAANAESGSVLAKVRLILGAFLSGETDLGLSELTQRTQLKKATVFRLASGMVETGLLEKSNGRFRLSLFMFELGSKVRVQKSLRAISNPFLRALHATTRETVYLSSLRVPMAVCVERLAAEDGQAARWMIGDQMPMHSTAAGKSMLAYLSPDVIEQHFNRSPLPAMTKRTITSPEMLTSSLREVRRTRVAYDREESWPGYSSVAAPIFDSRNNVIGAVSVAGPSSRIKLESIANTVMHTAVGITRRASTQVDLC
ncbi:IclR family transcriptional regulator [Microbacterium sp. X-17]|uniref:IclR family transcriptional regulator n=1 Tax=Microbacterium sp. X-17 TaxID=3144404 RepID=UPI0031F4FB93